jgi:hypothetical protein
MDINPFLKSLEATGVAASIRDSLFLFPVIEAIHVIGIALVFGTILIIDLRALGLASIGRRFDRMSADLMKWTWAAFVLTAITGALMFVTNAQVYTGNLFFQIKLALLALAGANMLLFQLTAGRTVNDWCEAPTAPTVGKVAATVSLILWISIIFMGRMIGFTITGAAVQEPPPSSVNFDDFLSGDPGAGPPAPPPPAN